jgi:hypothetical protein
MLLSKELKHVTGEAVLFEVTFLYMAIIALSIVAFLGVVGFLWRRGKTIEALLIWLSMWLT